MSISDRREFLKPAFLLNKVKRSMGQFKKLFTVAIIHYSMLEKLSSNIHFGLCMKFSCVRI